MPLTLRHTLEQPAISDWRDDNSLGLSHATAAEWLRATDAFSRAVHGLTQINGEIADGAGDQEALALTLGNLAHASFRAGRLEQALDYADQAIELRTALTGAESMPTVRARMDRSVIRVAAGALDQAREEIMAVLELVEAAHGPMAPSLATILENLARLELASGQPAAAVPVLHRLRSLCQFHGLATGRADQLLARYAPPAFDSMSSLMEPTASLALLDDLEFTEPLTLTTESVPPAVEAETEAEAEVEASAEVEAEAEAEVEADVDAPGELPYLPEQESFEPLADLELAHHASDAEPAAVYLASHDMAQDTLAHVGSSEIQAALAADEDEAFEATGSFHLSEEALESLRAQLEEPRARRWPLIAGVTAVVTLAAAIGAWWFALT